MKKHSANTFGSIELSSQEKKKTVSRKFLPQNSATARFVLIIRSIQDDGQCQTYTTTN